MKPVDTSQVTNYSDFVFNPLDLSTLEKVSVVAECEFFLWLPKRKFGGKCQDISFQMRT